jgi:hypothetical protein
MLFLKEEEEEVGEEEEEEEEEEVKTACNAERMIFASWPAPARGWGLINGDVDKSAQKKKLIGCESFYDFTTRSTYESTLILRTRCLSILASKPACSFIYLPHYFCSYGWPVS